MKLSIVVFLAIAFFGESQRLGGDAMNHRPGTGGRPASFKYNAGRGGFGTGRPDAEYSVVDCQGVPPQQCGRDGGLSDGVLVCRTHRRDNSTKTMCVDPQEGFEGDTCGCCGEECPTACTERCTDDLGVDGVLIGSRYTSVCVSELESVTMQLKGRHTCVLPASP